MNVTVKKLTNIASAQRACKFTLHSHNDTTIGLAALYRCEHSPMYTQWFWIELIGIPSFVAMHMRTHEKNGAVHFIQTQREDRGADTVADRNTQVNMAMMMNAKHLIDMARKRLCSSTHRSTRYVMNLVLDEVAEVDTILSTYMVRDCQYRGGCVEHKCCGFMEVKK